MNSLRNSETHDSTAEVKWLACFSARLSDLDRAPLHRQPRFTSRDLCSVGYASMKSLHQLSATHAVLTYNSLRYKLWHSLPHASLADCVQISETSQPRWQLVICEVICTRFVLWCQTIAVVFDYKVKITYLHKTRFASHNRAHYWWC